MKPGEKRLRLILNFLLTEGVEEIRTLYDKDSCIASSRIAVDFLKKFGYVANVFPVHVKVVNAALWKRIQAGETITQLQAQDGMVSVGFKGKSKATNGEYSGGDFWDGHLVALAEGFLIDMTLDQLSHPEFGIELQPVAFVLPEKPVWPLTYLFDYVEGSSSVLSYYSSGDREYMDCGDWVFRPSLDAQERLVSRMMRKMIEWGRKRLGEEGKTLDNQSVIPDTGLHGGT